MKTQAPNSASTVHASAQQRIGFQWNQKRPTAHLRCTLFLFWFHWNPMQSIKQSQSDAPPVQSLRGAGNALGRCCIFLRKQSYSKLEIQRAQSSDNFSRRVRVCVNELGIADLRWDTLAFPACRTHSKTRSGGRWNQRMCGKWCRTVNSKHTRTHARTHAQQGSARCNKVPL